MRHPWFDQQGQLIRNHGQTEMLHTVCDCQHNGTRTPPQQDVYRQMIVMLKIRSHKLIAWQSRPCRSCIVMPLNLRAKLYTTYRLVHYSLLLLKCAKILTKWSIAKGTLRAARSASSRRHKGSAGNHHRANMCSGAWFIAFHQIIWWEWLW